MSILLQDFFLNQENEPGEGTRSYYPSIQEADGPGSWTNLGYIGLVTNKQPKSKNNSFFFSKFVLKNDESWPGEMAQSL